VSTLTECVESIVPPLTIVEKIKCALEITSHTVARLRRGHLAAQPLPAERVGVTSHDPNEKVGPIGAGFNQYIRGNGTSPYAIYFENDVAAATAPAADVVVSDTLDATKYDLSTVALGPIRFGDHLLTPAPGSTSYLATVDLRTATPLVVKVDARLDPATGILTWRLSSIDPNTGAPPTDPTLGFLPPNAAPPLPGICNYTCVRSVADDRPAARQSRLDRLRRERPDPDEPLDEHHRCHAAGERSRAAPRRDQHADLRRPLERVRHRLAPDGLHHLSLRRRRP
jgi:hypothetical protein